MSTLPAADALQPLFFQPPPRGDIVLRSNDGVDFRVHTAALSAASSVFKDMFTVGTPGNEEVVDLAEDARTMSLMFEFIYSTRQVLDISDEAMFHTCLDFASKYDLSATLEAIDADLCLPASKLCPDSLDLFFLANKYPLPKAKAIAFRRVHRRILDPKWLATIAQAHPAHQALIALIGIQGAQYRILTDVILRFRGVILHPLDDDYISTKGISCEDCEQRLDDGILDGVLFPPTWLTFWSNITFDALRGEPLEKCAHYFDVSIFDSFYDYQLLRVCDACVEKISDDPDSRVAFNNWATQVKSVLAARLATLDPVHQLYR